MVRYSLYGQYKGKDRRSSRPAQKREGRKSTGGGGGGALSVDARPFYLTGEAGDGQLSPSVTQMGEALLSKV